MSSLPPEASWDDFALYLAERDERGLLAASIFYKEHLLDIATTAASADLSAADKYKRVIAPLGFSPEAVAVAALALQADRLTLIATHASAERSLPALQLLVDGRLELEHFVVDGERATEIYKVVQSVVDGAFSADDIGVAIVGGTNVMVAAVAAAGDLLGYDLWHLAGDTAPERPIPYPWTQRLVPIEPSISTLSALPRQRARASFDDERFVDAAEQFGALAQRTRSAEDRVFEQLSRAYNALNNYDGHAAADALNPLLRTLVSEQSSPALNAHLRDQQRLCRLLGAPAGIGSTHERIESLIGWLAARGPRLLERGDMLGATQISYRGLEAIAQRRCLDYGISLRARAAEAGHLVNGPPERFIGLDDRWRILEHHQDGVTQGLRSEAIRYLRQARNDSVLAHGTIPPSRQTARQFVECITTLVDDGIRELGQSRRWRDLARPLQCRQVLRQLPEST